MRRLQTCLLIALSITLWALTGCGGDGKSPVASLFDDFAPPKPSEAARDAFDVYDADKRRRSITLLSNAPWGGEAEYLRLYRLLVDDPDPTVQAAALRALGEHGEVEDALLIIPHLGHPAKVARWEATKALQRIHHKRAVDPLIERLTEDDDVDVRSAAAQALGQYRAPRVFQALIGALDDRSFAVASAARGSLRTLTGRNLGDTAGPWLEWAESHRNLFDDGERYLYRPYQKSPGLLDRMQFWKERPEPQPETPRGVEPEPIPGDS